MEVKEADNLCNNVRPVHVMPRSSIPALRIPIFYWKAANKYHKLCNFEMEVKNIFKTNKYNMQESEMILIILNWQSP